jgi:hypothetical protein
MELSLTAPAFLLQLAILSPEVPPWRVGPSSPLLVDLSRRRKEQKEEEDRITEEGAEVVLFSVNVRYPVFSTLSPCLLLLSTWAYMDHLSNGKRELGLRTRRPDTLVCSSCSSLSS